MRVNKLKKINLFVKCGNKVKYRDDDKNRL